MFPLQVLSVVFEPIVMSDDVVEVFTEYASNSNILPCTDMGPEICVLGFSMQREKSEL